MKRLLTILTLACIFNTIGYGQQDAQFTQYMYNMSNINPAYATATEGVLNIGGIYRSQWVGAVGAPTTASLFLHSPISEKIELGLNVIHDELGEGVVNENTITADFAYVLQLNNSDAKLSFGLKAGVNMFQTNFDGFLLNDPVDAAFRNNNQTFLNIGAGAFYFTDRYYLGLSVPNFLPNKHLDSSNEITPVGVDEAHFFFTGGYVFNLNNNLKLKPAFMSKVVSGAPIALDITANVLINNRFEVGAAYRLDDSFSALANFRVTPELRIGYAYDYTTTALGDFNSGTHEVFIIYDLGLDIFNKGYEKSPRFF